MSACNWWRPVDVRWPSVRRVPALPPSVSAGCPHYGRPSPLRLTVPTTAGRPHYGWPSPLRPTVPTTADRPHYGRPSPLRPAVPTTADRPHYGRPSPLRPTVPTTADRPHYGRPSPLRPTVLTTADRPHYGRPSPQRPAVPTTAGRPHYGRPSPLRPAVPTTADRPHYGRPSPLRPSAASCARRARTPAGTRAPECGRARCPSSAAPPSSCCRRTSVGCPCRGPRWSPAAGRTCWAEPSPVAAEGPAAGAAGAASSPRGVTAPAAAHRRRADEACPGCSAPGWRWRCGCSPSPWRPTSACPAGWGAAAWRVRWPAAAAPRPTRSSPPPSARHRRRGRHPQAAGGSWRPLQHGKVATRSPTRSPHGHPQGRHKVTQREWAHTVLGVLARIEKFAKFPGVIF